MLVWYFVIVVFAGCVLFETQNSTESASWRTEDTEKRIKRTIHISLCIL